MDFKWAPAGDPMFFAGGPSGVVNLWRVKVDRLTLESESGPERLTTGIGPDGEVALSPDGSKLAFVTSRNGARLGATL